MARGSEAKKVVTNKIIEAFGSDYVTTVDGKVYVWANDGGERVQIAISLTCPKNLIGAIEGTKISAAALDFGGGGWDFEAMDQKVEIAPKSTEITQQEIDNIETLMRQLNLL